MRMATTTKKRPTNSSGGTAVHSTTAAPVLCRKVIFKEGSRIVYSGNYSEGDWASIGRKFNSVFMGLELNETLTITATGVMAVPTRRT